MRSILNQAIDKMTFIRIPALLLVMGAAANVFGQSRQAVIETPEPLEFGWQTASLAEVNLNPYFLATLLDSITNGSYVGINGLAIAKDGKLVFEKYTNGFNPYVFQDVRSATKSITSLFVGTLIDAGYFDSETYKICRHFPGTPCDNDLRIKDIIQMRTGLDCNDYTDESAGSEGNTFEQKDWYHYTLSQKRLGKPGSHFSYCTMGVNLLSQVIEDRTKKDIRKLADSLLFRPMDIRYYNWYTNTPSFKPYMGGFFTIFLRDFLKFGQLMVNEGKWKTRQVVSAEWIEKIRNAALPIEEGSPKRYGYLWWQEDIEHNGKTLKVMMASGNGGQKIIAVKELSVVVAFFGSQFFSPYHENEQPLKIFKDHVLNAIK